MRHNRYPELTTRPLVKRATASLLLWAMTIQPLAAQLPPARPDAPPPAASARMAAAAAVDPFAPKAGESRLFGPEKYIRTTGPKDVYEVKFAAPKWVVAPFRLHIENGEPVGENRVSSATIVVNAKPVLEQKDLNTNVAALDRAVTLAAANTMTVTLASAPSSFLRLGLFGKVADGTAPQVTIAAPAAGAVLDETTPRLVVRYADALNPAEPAASGVDTNSLRVTLDGTDITALFTKRSDEATAVPESALAAGTHELVAVVRDFAGNAATARAAFRVDVTAPELAITAPAAGAYSATATPAIALTFRDDVAIDPASLHIAINGTDRTASFTVTPGTATWAAAGPLPEGPNQIAATIRDTAGNAATDALSFNVDVQAPVVTIAAPAAGAVLGSKEVAVVIRAADDQALAAGTLAVTLDGSSITATLVDGVATLKTPALADGAHTLSVQVADRAANVGTATAAFRVDTDLPAIAITAPAAGANVKTASPDVAITYADTQGLQAGSLKVTVNGTDRTSLFTQGESGSHAAVSLPDGAVTVVAQITDSAGNVGRAESSFRVDTAAPTGAIELPPSLTNSATPAVRITYDDSGSGVDPETLRVRLDGSDVTALFARDSETATALLETLTDGSHVLQASVADRAGNPFTASRTFVVDTTRPMAAIVAPADDSFVTTATPQIRVTFADGSGSGVDVSTLRIHLGETDITSYFTVGNGEATGQVPASAPLEEGTNVLRVTLQDDAGNAVEASSSFEVDTIAPTFTLDAPSPKSYIHDSTPLLHILFADDRSGVDAETLRIDLDAVESTERFTLDATSATLALTAPLAEGRHTVAVTLFDRAGNRTTRTESFTVDTIAPVATIAVPAAGTVTSVKRPAIRIAYTDASGVDPATVRLTLDGADVTAALTATTSEAVAVLTADLTDGPHALEATMLDWAGNAAAAQRTFTVDSTAPVVTITAPEAGAYTSAATVKVTGSVADDSAVTVTVNSVAATLVGGTFTAAAVPVGAEGQVTLVAVATDAAGNRGEATVAVRADRSLPVVTIDTPAAGAILKGPAVQVSGSVTDASPVTVEVNDTTVLVGADHKFSTTISAADGPFAVRAEAKDAAGNEARTSVSVTVDATAPVISFTAPAAGAATKTTPVTIRGTVADLTTVTLTADGHPVALTGTSFSYDAPLAAEGPVKVTFTATDAAANVATRDFTLTYDKTAPALQIATPEENAVVANLPLVVRGVATDATAVTVTVNGVAADATESGFEASFATLGEGPQALVAIATDAAGNSSSVTRKITLDTAAPVVKIDTPVAGMVTRGATATVSGSVTDVSLASVTVNGTAATVQTPESGSLHPFTLTAIALTEGDNTLRVVATDAAARTGEATVVVTRDSTAPVVAVTAPAQLAPSATAQVRADVTDNLGVESVRFALNESDLALLTAAPYVATLTVPAGTAAGTTLTLTVEARDRAGNSTVVTKAVTVVSAGVVTGQVLADETGLPVEGALVSLAGSSKSARTDERGHYTLAVNDLAATLLISATGTTGVERQVSVSTGVGTVPVDARLTLLSSQKQIASSGRTWTEGDVTIAVPAGALPAGTNVRLTRLSPQGLPNLLPLGWSPLAAFDLRSGAAFVSAASIEIPGINAPSVDLVRYDGELHAWKAVDATLVPAGKIVRFPVSAAGTYALVVADTPALTAVDGQLLPAAAMVALPNDVASIGEVTPPTLPTTGGNARASVALQTTTPLPSGTVVAAEVTETYTLTSGEEASAEKRTQDIVTYRTPAPAGAMVAAEIPVAPSRTYESSELTEGRIHLDILAGRETVRGKSGGTTEAVSITEGALTVTVPAGSFEEDTAIVVKASPLSTFAAAAGSMQPVTELTLDLGGRTLTAPAQLTVKTSTGSASDTWLFARVDRVDGRPLLNVVALGTYAGGSVTTAATPELSGITTGGRYVVYRSTSAVGFLRGTTRAGTSAVRAIVRAANSPFAAYSDFDGAFTTVAAIGATKLTATVPSSSMNGETTVSAIAAQTVQADIQLTAATTTATVTPADGETRVSPSVQVDLSATTAMAATAAQVASVRLVDAGGAAVPVKLVLSASRAILSVVPQVRLAAATRYTLTVTNLFDTYGALVIVPPTSFTTRSEEAPQYDPNRIVVTMPDANGIIHVTAPAGSMPPGTTVLIVATGSGMVISFTAGNDGSLSGEFPGTIDDTLLITITDPLGNITNFQRSKFVATDGSGRVAIGPGGGTIEGPGGTGVRIPEGALTRGITFQLEPFGAGTYPERPEFPGAHFGSGLRVTVSDPIRMKKEAKLVFPKPADAPDGAFFYVYRRLVSPKTGAVTFETIDHAFIEGSGADARVVTASYPFVGFEDSTVSWEAAASSVGFGLGAQVNFFLMWTWDALLPGTPTAGLITGRVVKAQWKPGAMEPEYVGVPGIGITAHDPLTAVSQSQRDGTFSIWDPKYSGGPVDVTAHLPSGNVTVTAYEADPDTTRDRGLPQQYRNKAIATFIIDSRPQFDVPKFEVHLLHVRPDQKREEVAGLVPSGTELLIGFERLSGSSAVEIVSATINGVEYPVRKEVSYDPVRTDFVISEPYTPQEAREYVVKATSMPVLGGAPVIENFTFLVIASGGNNSKILNDAQPDIISKLLVPKANETGVPTDVHPQVVFTEPVRVPASAVHLSGPNGDVPMLVAASAVTESGSFYTIPDLREASASARITAITLQPLYGLEYDKDFEIRLDGASITDFDTTATGSAAPKALRGGARVFAFHTMVPENLSESAEAFSSPGLVVLGDRAYIGIKQNAPNGLVGVFEVSDPLAVAELAGARRAVIGQPTDIDGEDASPLTNGGRTIIAGAGLATLLNSPSNLFIWDATNPDDLQRKGIVSVTQDSGDGILLKLDLKGSFAYTITYPKGIMVIDLARAMANYRTAEETGQHANFIKDALQPGTGVSQDAIVATIPARAANGSLAHLFDIKAGDFILGSNSQTLVLATGSVPLYIADPLRGTTLLNAPVLARDGFGKITFGRALALGTLGEKRVAVVVGVGEGLNETGTVEGPYAIAMVDMTNPLSPAILGTLRLAKSPSDVVFRDRKAVVAAEGVGLIIDFTDPTKPRLAGELPNVGQYLALSDLNIVYSTASTTSDSAVKVGVYVPTAVIDSVDPVMTKISNPADGSTTTDQEPRFEVGLPVVLRSRIVPYVSGTQVGQLAVTQRDVPYAAFSPVFQKGVATNTIDPGKPIEIHDPLRAKLTVDTRFGPLTSSKTIPVGWIRAVVDSNNDLKIDSRDSTRNRGAAVFAFWEKNESDLEGSDPNYRALEDFATLRLQVTKQWSSAHPGAIKLRLVAPGAGNVVWELTEKMAPELDYLRFKPAAEEQMANILATPDCAPDAFLTKGLCRSNASGRITLRGLPTGQHDFLLRCVNCPADVNAPTQIKYLQLEYVPGGAEAAQTIDQVRVDIRPMEQWMHAVTVRSTTGDVNVPDGYYRDESAQYAKVPGKVKRQTILIHGYNNSGEVAATYFRHILRRFYWAGRPMLRRQSDDHNAVYDGEGCARNCAHVSVVHWPGDVIPVPAARFPESEFMGLASGVGIARFLADNRLEHPSAEITAFAHSLGNLALNSALSRREGEAVPGRLVDNYVAYEGAMAAEALDTAGCVAPYDRILRAHGELTGFPNDVKWITEFDDMKERSGTSLLDPYERWNNTVTELGTRGVAPLPRYDLRWQQPRPDTVPDREEPSSMPARGPWKGFFKGTRQKVGRFINLFNTTDTALSAWHGSNLALKPGPAGSDDRLLQEWGNGKYVDNATSQKLWHEDLKEHGNILRQWWELAFWFTALTEPMGHGPVPGAENHDFTHYYRGCCLNVTDDSHNYLNNRPFWEVYSAFQTVTDTLDPAVPAPPNPCN